MSKKQMAIDTSLFSKPQLEADGDNALEVVMSLGADIQGELVEAWVVQGNVDAVTRIAQDDEAPAPARKAARRGLNVLKSRGIQTPEKPTVVRPLVAVSSGVLEVEAYFRIPDAAGTRAVSFATKLAGGALGVIDVFIDEDKGLVEMMGGTTSISRQREWHANLRKDHGFAPVKVPVDWARSEVAAARARNDISKHPVPLPWGAPDFQLPPAPATAPAHPAEAWLADLTGEQIEHRREQTASLHLEPEFGGYMPSREAVQELVDSIGQLFANVENPADMDQAKVSEMLTAELIKATDRFFTPERRIVLAARLLDIALSLHARQGVERARDVLAARELVQKAGLVTDPPSEVPFLRFYFQKALAYVAQQNRSGLPIPAPSVKKDAENLVIAPNELAAQEAQKAGKNVSSGGIILPT